MDDHRFIRACKGLPVDVTPVWFMRQAGRYLPEYRAIRQKHTLLEICRKPELCAEVTMLPVTLLGVDAAILFSDISVLFEPLGLPFEIRDNVGPVVHRPIVDKADVEKLRPLDPEHDLQYVYEAIRLLKRELTVPLIGFAGAPFTLASYLVEGGPSRSHSSPKRLMFSDEGLWNALMERLTGAVVAHLRAQVRAGASALQIFDSWVGCLDAPAYRRYVAPHMKRLFAETSDLNVPRIHFAVNGSHLLKEMREVGGDVIGVDWRIGIDEAWSRIGFDRSVQGNLDPARLLGPWEEVKSQALEILEKAAATGRTGHIFNLGHGVLPETPVDQLKRLVDLVHDNVPQQVTSVAMGVPSRFPTPLPRGKTGILLMAYGTPASAAEIEPYYTHIRGGRPPRPEHLADLVNRYRMIGGVSPLTAITLSLAHKLEHHLNVPVFVGMRHAKPFIAESLRRMAHEGIAEIVAIALAPHNSKMSIGAYIKAAKDAQEQLAAVGHSLTIHFVESWSRHPLFIQAIARRIRQAAARLPGCAPAEPVRGSSIGPAPAEGPLQLPDKAAVLFTAHSLPESIRRHGDPYEEELRASCQEVASALGLSAWHFAYQSAGKTPDPWLGPDVTEYIPVLAREGVRHIILCPIGFVADHLEIYYDIDIEAQTAAREHGIHLVRTESLNDHHDFVSILAAIFQEQLAMGAGRA